MPSRDAKRCAGQQELCVAIRYTRMEPLCTKQQRGDAKVQSPRYEGRWLEGRVHGDEDDARWKG